jgi:CBS domain-containing protein/sporulation protein YlmC with PRC-barrel domain
MTSKTTFYYSRIVGCKVHDENHAYLGRLKDLAINIDQIRVDETEPVRPKVTSVFIKSKGQFTFSEISITKAKKSYHVTCKGAKQISDEAAKDNLLLGESILDQQIVDINGRKVVRVNDIRMVAISEGVFAIAVDIGVEGLLRRIGIVKPVRTLFSLIGIKIPSKFILFDDVAAVDYTKLNIKLSKSYSKLHTLHPSDLADIIEDLGKASKTSVFATLDEEVAADVLEELETHEQIHIIESLTIEKAADVLEKMPANEAADIIDELEEEKAEMLLMEMESGSSEDVRELLEYPDRTVGSLMTTEVLSFGENSTIEEALNEIRIQKPEMEALYNLFVIDKNEKLIATLSLRDLVISEPQTKIKEIMNKNPISVFDEDKIDSLAEIISKYNLLAIPVTDYENKLEGMVVIDDVIEDLVGKRRTV